MARMFSRLCQAEYLGARLYFQAKVWAQPRLVEDEWQMRPYGERQGITLQQMRISRLRNAGLTAGIDIDALAIAAKIYFAFKHGNAGFIIHPKVKACASDANRRIGGFNVIGVFSAVAGDEAKCATQSIN